MFSNFYPAKQRNQYCTETGLDIEFIYTAFSFFTNVSYLFFRLHLREGKCEHFTYRSGHYFRWGDRYAFLSLEIVHLKMNVDQTGQNTIIK